MTVRQSIARWLLKDMSGSSGWIVAGGMGATPGQHADFKALATEGHNQNADVYAAVSLYSTAIGGIRWVLKKRQAGKRPKDWPVVEQHAFYDLWERPNPIYSQSEWIDRLVGYLFLGGEDIIHVTGPKSGQNAGEPRELWLLRPDFVELKKGDPRIRPIIAYEYQPNRENDPERIDPARIVHFRFFNPLDDYRGMSPFVAASLGIDQGNDGRKWNIKLMRRGGSPPGYFRLEGEQPSPEQQADLIRQWEQKVETGSPTGKPLVLGGGMEWVQTGMSARDTDWSAGIKLSTRDISNVARIPSELLGDPDARTYANRKSARQSFYTEGVLPVLDRIRDAFVAQLLPMYRDGANLYLDYDVNDIEALKEDENERWTRVTAARHLTLNEKRVLTGQEAVDGGDVFILGASDIPVTAEDLPLYAGGIDPTPNDPDADADSGEEDDDEE